MASGSRESLTAHLRGKLRKKPIQKRDPNRQNAKPKKNSKLENTAFYHWVNITKDDANSKPQTTSVEKDLSAVKNNSCPQEKTTQNGMQTILAQLSTNFESEKRPYAALASRKAAEFVEQGSEHRMNPGLWKYIRSLEDAVAENNE